MALVFHRSLAIPLWVVALCAVALAVPSRSPPSFTALLAVAVIGATMVVMGRWLGTHRPTVAVPPVAGRHPRPAGLAVAGAMRVRTLQPVSKAPAEETHDAMDLVRMDDGRWRVPTTPSGHARLKKP